MRALLSIICGFGLLAVLPYQYPPAEHIWLLIPIAIGLAMIFVAPYFLWRRP